MHYMAASTTTAASPNNKCLSNDEFHNWHLDLQERKCNPIAFHLKMMGENMYLHQALKQPSAIQFVKAVIKEVSGHIDRRYHLMLKLYLLYDRQ